MIIMAPYRAAHLDDLIRRAAKGAREWVAPDVPSVLEAADGVAFSVFDEGRAWACGGIATLASNRGLAWTYIDALIGPHRFAAASQMVRRVLDASPLERIEATVACDYAKGHRWAKRLGFELETPRMRCYNPDGTDAAMYVRIRH